MWLPLLQRALAITHPEAKETWPLVGADKHQKEDGMDRRMVAGGRVPNRREREKEEAMAFANSARGKYIMAQALYHGIRTMESLMPEYLREDSNLADMRYLRKYVFDVPDEAFYDVRRNPHLKP